MNPNPSRFKKGLVPWNKGKKIALKPGSKRAQFKRGNTPANKAIGSERIDRQGYVVISIEGKRHGVFKHRLFWEQKYGPIPRDCVLKCKGDKANVDPSNWTLVPLAVVSNLNSRNYDTAPAELKPTIMAVAKLAHSVREKERGER
jgi:hypothetical protein